MTLTTLRCTCRVYPWKIHRSLTSRLDPCQWPCSTGQGQGACSRIPSTRPIFSTLHRATTAAGCCLRDGHDFCDTRNTALRPQCRLRRHGRTNAETLGHLLLLPSSLLVQAAQGSVGCPSLSSTSPPSLANPPAKLSCPLANGRPDCPPGAGHCHESGEQCCLLCALQIGLPGWRPAADSR